MKKVIYASLAFVPALVFADANITGLTTLVKQFGTLLASVIPIIFALAIIFFFWGLVQFLRGAGDPKMHDAGKMHMVYGIIAIAVMLSVYGLVNFLQSSTGVTNTGPIPVPTVTGLGN